MRLLSTIFNQADIRLSAGTRLWFDGFTTVHPEVAEGGCSAMIASARISKTDAGLAFETGGSMLFSVLSRRKRNSKVLFFSVIFSVSGFREKTAAPGKVHSSPSFRTDKSEFFFAEFWNDSFVPSSRSTAPS